MQAVQAQLDDLRIKYVIATHVQHEVDGDVGTARSPG